MGESFSGRAPIRAAYALEGVERLCTACSCAGRWDIWVTTIEICAHVDNEVIARILVSAVIHAICLFMEHVCFAGCLREGVGDNARALAGAFQAAAGAIATYGGAAEGDRTMLDALLPAARALQDAVESGQGLAGSPCCWQAAAEAQDVVLTAAAATRCARYSPPGVRC